jgi:hypothetical protein
VIGFELFNEPDTGSAELDAFYARAGQAVRDAAPQKLVFFEPPALRNFTDFIPLPSAPFAISGAVYSPHIYTYVFQSDPTRFQTATVAELEPSVQAARDEATAWQAPLFIGEFGVGPTDDAAHNTWMHAQAQLHARYFASNAFWVWKEHSQGSWGVHDYDATSATWSERPLVVGWVSRVHVARIAGTPRSVEASEVGDAIRVELEPGSAVAAPHLVYIPERFATSIQVRCDGASVDATRDPSTGLVAAACGGVLEAKPR